MVAHKTIPSTSGDNDMSYVFVFICGALCGIFIHALFVLATLSPAVVPY